MKRARWPRLSGAADRIGRGADRRARFRRRRSTTSRCCARWSASGAAWSRARWTPRTRSIPRRRSSRPRSRCIAWRRRAASRARPRASCRRRPRRSRMPSARSIRAGTSRASRRGSTASTPRWAACTAPISSSSPAAPAWARPRSPPTSRSTPPSASVRDKRGRDRGCQVARRRRRLLQPRNVRGPARHAYPRRAIGDQRRESAHGQDQPARFPQPRARRRRSRDTAALHRRHAGPDDRGAAHARAPPEAPARDRPDHRRLSAAAVGLRPRRARPTACRRFRRSRAASSNSPRN